MTAGTITPTPDRVLYMTDHGMKWEPRWRAESAYTGQIEEFPLYSVAQYWLELIARRIEAKAHRWGVEAEEAVRLERVGKQ